MSSENNCIVRTVDEVKPDFLYLAPAPCGNSRASGTDPHVLPGLVAFYLAITLAEASSKLLWVDEFFTLYVSQQPHVRGVWHALAAGADPNPPLMHLLAKASTILFGVNALALRLPSILSVLLAILAMWWVLRRWVSPLYAAVGVLAFMATRGFDYSYDARSYGLLMGFCMASLASWMYASDAIGLRRTLALGAITVFLAAGLSSNYYGVLAFFPIALGEAFRPRRRPGVWIALAVAGLPLFAFFPLIRHDIAEFAPYAWNRPQPSMISLTYLELVEGIFWPVSALILFTLWRRRNDAWPISRPEAAAVITLLIYPFLGFLIAIAGAGMVSPRCVAPVCCGFGLAASLLAQRVFAHLSLAALAIVTFLACWVFVRETACAAVLLQQRQAFTVLTTKIARTSPGAPIMVGDSALVLPLYFYSSAEVRRRIIFPVDFEAIHRFEPDDSGEQNLWAGRHGVFPFPIIASAALPLPPSSTIVLSRPDGWLTHDLEARGLHLRVEPAGTAWDSLGGVFTPMAHSQTRILTTQP